VVIGLFSCSNDDNQGLRNPEEVVGTWELTKIINNSAGGETTPNPNETHSYIINNDGTFRRIALKDEITTEFTGEYILTDTNSNFGNENGDILKFIELTYSSEVIFFNCGALSDNEQLLILTEQNLLRNELEGICDGNSFEYTKK